MSMTHRENWLRTIEFRSPEWIPCSVSFAPITWKIYREDLEKVIADHPKLWPGFEPGRSCFFDEMPDNYREGETYLDNWGCLWKNVQEGLEGIVIEHPLADWSALDTYAMPDPETKVERGDMDWDATAKHIAATKEAGGLTGGYAERLFDRMYFLRPFEDLMIDIATDDPRLTRLVNMLTQHELKMVGNWLSLGVDFVAFHTDIGTQDKLMIRPESFRKHIKPMFMEIFQTCRKAGSHVVLSSDGHVLEIVDDLIECGVSMHDPQIRANTLEGIERCYKGKMCVTVDLDRQGFPFQTPQEIKDEIARVVDVMGDPKGGLMLSAGVWGADVPLANIDAICVAMEENCFG